MHVFNRCKQLEVNMSGVSAICRGCDLKIKDWPGLFCSTKSDECASAREYYYCMQQHGDTRCLLDPYMRAVAAIGLGAAVQQTHFLLPRRE